MHAGETDKIQMDLSEICLENKAAVITLIDLPELCLDSIVSYLAASDLIDLINVAASHSNLKSCADRVYILKYGDFMKYPQHNHHLDLLRVKHFGAYITSVEVYVNEDRENIHEFLHEMFQQCTTLARLSVWFEGWTNWDQADIELKLKDPITSVCKLEYWVDHRIHKSWTDIKRWFPNVRSFEYFCEDMFDTAFEASFAAHLPSLEYFHFQYDGDHSIKKSFHNVGNFVNENPQISVLKIWIGEYYESQLCVDWESMEITELHLLGVLKGEFKGFLKLKNLFNER